MRSIPIRPFAANIAMALIGLSAVSSSIHLVEGRSWKDMTFDHDLAPTESLSMSQTMEEENALEFSFAPSVIPSRPPFMRPTSNPTGSLEPTQVRSSLSTLDPSEHPTLEPSFVPSFHPSFDPYPANPTPMNPPNNYFNYDRRPGAEYGPGNDERIVTNLNQTHDTFTYRNNQWGRVQFVGAQDYWWEFSKDGFGPLKGMLSGYNPARNYCNTNNEQSPINLIDTGRECVPYHQIRPRPGDYKLDHVNVSFQILPNKLRVQYPRRPCLTCAEPDPPHADFPDGWGGGADLLHIDIKIPSEHTMEGKQFAGEYQLFHLHAGRKRSPTMSIFIDYNETSPTNTHFQKLVAQFWRIYNQDKTRCATQQRRERRLVSRMRHVLGLEPRDKDIDYSIWDKFSTDADEPGNFELRGNDKHDEETLDENGVSTSRKLQRQDGESVGTPGRWNPYERDSILRTHHFYGYEGSTTDPPCGTFVHWYIQDTPMIVSKLQYEQLKAILFTHTDQNCQSTSVQYAQSVARPIQDLAHRGVFRCTRRDFNSDEFVAAKKAAEEAATQEEGND